MDQEEEAFEEFARSNPIDGVVGSAEIDLRRLLGNERYEKSVAFDEAQAATLLATSAAFGARHNALAGLYSALTLAVLTSLAGGLGWTIWAWVH